MRKILYILITCVLSWFTHVGIQAKAHISGKINEHQEALFMIIQVTDDSILYDTIQVAPDGSFDIKVEVPKAGNGFFFCEDPKASAVIFIEDGMEADLKVSFTQKEQYGEMLNELVLDYTGDNKDCYEFNMRSNLLQNYEKWPWDKLSAIDFITYRNDVERDFEDKLGQLYQVKSENYRRIMGAQLEDEHFSNLCRFGWAKRNQTDKDFERWILSFDHNDTKNMDKIGNYWRWYLESNFPPRAERTPYTYYQMLKEAFTNQDIINIYAADWARQTMKDAPADIDEQLAAFKEVTTNTKDIAEVEQLYKHYSKLKVGAPAADFDFHDKSGKRYILKDLRGKAVYIDCWATWCGPCCMEIPHMEKLYAHYKNSKKVELISISLDDSKQKWEKKIAADKPGWRQFIVKGNFKSQLCQNYDIDAIPRFLMFDKRGNIISLDAPRPSDPKIIKWIDSNLK